MTESTSPAGTAHLTGTRRTVPVRGGALEVRLGEGAGPALVFAHYWGGTAGTWDGVLRQLPPGRATVRFDQRGWGASRALPGPYGLEQSADDLAAVAETCVPGPYVLVGHSMGGKASLLLAGRRPAGLAGLVLLAPAPPRPPAGVTEEYRQGLSHAYDAPATVGHALDHVLTAAPLAAEARAAAVRDSLSAGEEARRAWPLHGIAEDITGAVGGIEVPVTVLAAEHDLVEPPEVLRAHLLPYVPHAELVTVPASGHLLPLEAPAAVAAALTDFLARLPGRSAG